ncbi:hypothetical protein FGG08_006218 [Glutinoglossum americanum]|uniref:RNA-dependent RNA polymerase n=1 Tax=Glutinoglossum americanum TaxID=1670608 RepID=A0A9P8I3X5_9PEZI|nr:hypothetical protein FGG08_006218 [Glutinoglossum americanum]
MEIFVYNIPYQVSEKRLDKFFRRYLAECSIQAYHCQKLRGKGWATLTVGDKNLGQKFLSLHEKGPGSQNAKVQLVLMNRHIYCKTSNKQPDGYLVESLQKEEADNQKKIKTKKPAVERAGQPERKFDFHTLSCGLWDYARSDPVFLSHSEDHRNGAVMFGVKSMTLLLHPMSLILPTCRLDIPYSSVNAITTGGRSDPTITLTLLEAPRMFENTDTSLLDIFGRLSLQSQPRNFIRKRVTSISSAHESIVNSCLVYRVTLLDPCSVNHVHTLLKKGYEMPQGISWLTMATIPVYSFSEGMSRLNLALCQEYQKLPFGLKFQIQKLAQNGYLPPMKVVSLLPELSLMASRSGDTVIVRTVQRLFYQIPFAGPGTEAVQLTVESLIGALRDNEKACKRESSYMQNPAEKHQHIALIHTARVTPAGTYLFGPVPETKNRVLRKYSDHADCFLRVSFLDEDGETIRFDRHASLEDVFHVRFKKVLGAGITIAGRVFEFLGFSHSSLRSQTCWFMAPFMHEGVQYHARQVIEKLGDFSQFRSPAKCAARIGQAFSDTFSTVHIPASAVREIPDVERLGRNFSDGVGTISPAVLQRIWNGYALSRELKPTLFQIRFAGAKGMLSLDDRLDGDVLNLRPSMVKFVSEASDIEICGAAFRPLPLYLNRQTIKILEDLGVEDDVFLSLQADAVDKLRRTIQSPINAASFLERNTIGKAAQLPWLIKKLNDLQLPFQEDRFIRRVVELAVLFQLRELKHRSRILVEEGYTLYGIMDETNILQEGQIFCVVETEEGGRSVIVGNVTITRAPALHPGDIQVATAVNVPADSPLNALHNCVVFSQRGRRDLPSQLSGGDLDGDLYNVIIHPGLRPKRTHQPADYPRVSPFDLGETVQRHHMTDFFIQFMENDQLGRIATLHQTLADQRMEGTLNPDCLTLASMHSDAVDFSKSGIPVDMKNCPKYNMCRPDFMATGPRVKIDKDIQLDDIELAAGDGEEDIISDLDPDGKGYRYYESKKVLGKLYRAIDERAFLAELQEQSERLSDTGASRKAIMQRLWDYVQRVTDLIQWRHHQDRARDIKDIYGDCLNDTRIQYSTHPLRRLSELEIFVGTIIGKTGIPNKRQRDISTDMKEKFDQDVSFIIDYIINDNEDGIGDGESLERSIACFAVAMEDGVPGEGTGALESFKYIAAAVCLKEVEKFQGWSSTFGTNF